MTTHPKSPKPAIRKTATRTPKKPARPTAAYITHLREAMEHASRDLDRAVLAGSGGALALSLTFLRDLGSNPNHPNFLKTAWILLFASPASMLASVAVSGYNIRRRLARIRKNEDEGTQLRWLTRRLTDLSCLLLIAGVAFLIYFAVANV